MPPTVYTVYLPIDQKVHFHAYTNAAYTQRLTFTYPDGKATQQ